MPLSLFRAATFVALLLICFCASPKRAQIESHADPERAIHAELSDSLLLPTCTGEGQLVPHTGYWLCYSESHEQASWVFYQLTRQRLEHSVTERTNNFRADPAVQTGSATPEDYVGSRLDRGHLFNAEIASYSLVAENDCFYMSNVSPQSPSFNRGVWKRLENRERKYAKNEGKLFVATGGVLHQGLRKIGSNGVSVPEEFYKVILSTHGEHYKGIGFLIPNKQCKDSLYNYVVSIDSVEHLTGIDFYPALPDSIEKVTEALLKIVSDRPLVHRAICGIL